jgi:hypothetical protein
VLYIIDDILEQMVIENKKFFSPNYICNRANISDLKEVTEYLLRQVGNKLNVFYEVECPEGDSDFAVKSPLELPTETKTCHICGTEYVPRPDKIWVVFDFIPEYRDYVKKKRKPNHPKKEYPFLALV